jgi:PAS domain S-box-containing protein
MERAFQKTHVLPHLTGRKNADEKARQTAKELERGEAMIRRLVDANVLGIFVWRLEGAIVGSNEAFLRMLQFSREDLVLGRVRWTDLTPAEWREYDERALAAFRTSGNVEPYEKEYFRKDGSRVPVIVAGAFFEEGSIEGVTFALDLTTQKRAEAEIRTLKEQLHRENLGLRDEVDGSTMFEEIVGTSKPLKAVLCRIAKVAPTDSTVFIAGETGTGKELIARAVHKRSLRSGRAFVTVNCAALSPSLISSELFGHEKGAFTGATQKRLGRFELADGGTIFLDEVGELLPDIQAALLRVLQEREFERVGGGRPLRVDVRVIAATNQDLKLAVANGTFRQDLFYRLNVFPIEAPPLRHRKDDILMLVQYYVQRYTAKMAKNICAIDKKTLDLLQSYDWPGNIRELQNVIERSVILSSDEVLSIDESWLSKDTWAPRPRAEPSAVFKIEGGPRSEREIIEAALAETRGRVSGPSGAAAKLRIPPSTLATRIKALRINKNQFKFG